MTVDPFAEDLPAVANAMTGGLGFDAVFDCTGKLEGACQAVHLAGPGGHVVWAAVYPVGGEVPVSPGRCTRRT